MLRIYESCNLSNLIKIQHLENPPNVGGDLKSERIINLAWTFDDGPTAGFSQKIHEFFLSKNIDAITFFIVKFRVDNWKYWSKTNVYEDLKKWNKAGNEIAVHTTQPDQDLWFRTETRKNKDGSFKHYDTETCLKMMKEFKKDLEAKGISTIRFARPVGGLISSLGNYMKEENGYSAPLKNVNGIIKGIINEDITINSELASSNSAVKATIETFNATMKWLKDSELRIGVGRLKNGDYKKRYGIDYQDWNAESYYIENHEKNDIFPKFKSAVDNKTVKNFIILSHDTNNGYFNTFKKNFNDIEKYARENHVQLNYKTMYDMFMLLPV